MTKNLSRRRISKTAAWTLPAVALSSAAPAQAASTPPAGCFLTDAQLNAGVCSAPSISPTDSMAYSSADGGVSNAKTLNDLGLVSACNYQGVTSIYWTASSGAGAQVPPASIKFTDGTTYIGHTGGEISSGAALAGLEATHTVEWDNSTGSINTPAKWLGAVVTTPFVWSYTAPNGTLHSCNFALQYTMGTPYAASGRAMVNPTIIAI